MDKQAPAINARWLQKEIMADMEKLFAKAQFKTPDGGMATLKAYAQQLPIAEADTQESLFPAIIVRLESGEIETQESPHKVKLLLWAGIFDDDLENNGHFAIMEILERIQQHYQERPALGAAVFSGPFEWALQDEQSFPYFYGGCYLTFDLPAPRNAWSEYT